MKTNIGSVANNVQIGRGGSIISDSADESISVKSSKSADLVDFYAKNLHASRVSVDYADIKNFKTKDVTVKVNDTVSTGDVIASAGTNNLNKDFNNHLYFELIIDGTVVNPEDSYDKTLNEL